MQQVRVGSSGLVVSRVCLGTGSFGGTTEERLALRVLDRALELGITTIDTADVYPHGSKSGAIGRTETLLGRWLRTHRDRVVVVTKGSYPTGPRAWQRGNGRRHLREAVDDSLRRLATDHIDLYLAHADDPHVDLDETLGVLDDLIRQGKILHAGVSNWSAWRYANALGRSARPGLARPIVAQSRYSLLHREAERDLLPLAETERVAVFAYNALYGGLLVPPQGDGAEVPERPDVVEALERISEHIGRSMVEVAFSWALTRPGLTGVVVGARRPEHLDAAVAAADDPLDEPTLAGLDELTRPWRGAVPAL